MTIRTASFLAGVIVTGILAFNGLIPDWIAAAYLLIFTAPTITE